MTERIDPKKSLGQHFLTDTNYCRKIVRFAAIAPEDIVVEIGPGTGELTRVLLESSARVIAVEFDRTLIQFLKERLGADRDLNGRLSLVEGDILHLDLGQIIGQYPVKLIGNLPYNISTRILSKTTEIKNRFQSFTFMVQKEVAERILASPGTKDYGYFTLLMQYHFRREPGFDVPPGVFVPRPKVFSHVMKLIPRDPPVAVADERRFWEIIKTAFRHRRKTLWNNLRPMVDDADQLRRAFADCHIEPKSRAEQLTLEQFACLTQIV